MFILNGLLSSQQQLIASYQFKRQTSDTIWKVLFTALVVYQPIPSLSVLIIISSIYNKSLIINNVSNTRTK